MALCARVRGAAVGVARVGDLTALAATFLPSFRINSSYTLGVGWRSFPLGALFAKTGPRPANRDRVELGPFGPPPALHLRNTKTRRLAARDANPCCCMY